MTQHGSLTMYNKHGCRCDECRAANTAWMQVWRSKQKDRPLPDYVCHGTQSAYNNYNCRCAECITAKSVSNRSYREARKAAS